MDRQVRATGYNVDNSVESGQIQARRDSLAVEIHRGGDYIHVAGPFAVPQQGSLNPIGTGKLRQFGCRNGAPAIVVRVDGERVPVATLAESAEQFNLVGKHVRHARFNGCRQVDDDFACVTVPDVDDSIANLCGDFGLGLGKALR